MSSNPDGLLYFPNVLSDDEHDALVVLLENANDWQKAGHRAKRMVKQYGFIYPYTNKSHLIRGDPMPDYILELINKIQQCYGLEQFQPDQAIVNRYLTGEGISKHIDDVALFGGTVVCVSLGADARMRFRNPVTGACYDRYVQPRSVYGMTSDARYRWTHEMMKNKSQKTTRYSITFRECLNPL